ncbi:MAG: hypothetical protein COT92_01990 [Candidatus Doudnabacteria bacterium CG10_big_fil_rev_8_21_14_0_10_42_18]|uniref:Uncharacterized protein n=1 Tax=Candidatus Doudnabacteria bacterium CG10_big_fil_rev_8_21_14_0_10_42_18 TaxID=1974552 RepID=A0A2H0VB16_9BACT|nr:MAG: hypothetical protein COT92_01990 [Candidatus Doudnabacteria bacterium CG10_big_fil_rev_8_21_14_0_10_42_18]
METVISLTIGELKKLSGEMLEESRKIRAGGGKDPSEIPWMMSGWSQRIDSIIEDLEDPLRMSRNRRRQ